MALIPPDKIAEVRDRTDIVAVIGEYVTLKRAGTNWKGLCPFHNEKSPSFNVNPAKQFFHCFGCGKSGDVFSFIAELDGKSFVDVLKDLAQRAGVELPQPPRSPMAAEHARRAETLKQKALRLNDLVADWFVEQLAAPGAEAAREYVASRGIGAGVQKSFRVGYAPAGWDTLTRFLESKKVPHELAEQVGLIRRREGAQVAPHSPPTKATHFDVFVDRVVYALTSPAGEVLGFGGRILVADDKQPKYKNSPETLLYKKGENLFGLHLAKHAIRRGGKALVVEGNFDVMTLHDVGIDYTVAPQGTALTSAQVALLGRFATEVLLMLDADAAGRAATMKIIHLFVEAELPARVVQLKPVGGKKVDPDDLARRDLPRLKQLIDEAVDAVEFFFAQVASTSLPTVPGRVAAIDECVGLLRAVKDPIARDLYIDRLASLLEVDISLVRRALVGHRGAAPAPQPRQAPVVEAAVDEDAAPVVIPRGINRIVAKLLSVLSYHGDLVTLLDDETLALFSDVPVRDLLASARAAGKLVPVDAIGAAAPEIKSAVAAAFASEEFAPQPGEEPSAARKSADKIVHDLIQQLKMPRGYSPEIEAQRQEALKKGDLALFRELTARIRAHVMLRKSEDINEGR